MNNKFGDFFQESVRLNSADVRALSNIDTSLTLLIKNLKSRFLDDFWRERPNKNEMFLLSFSQSFVSNFRYDIIKENLYSDVVESLKNANNVEVDESFRVISNLPITGSLYEPMCSISKSDKVVFYFGPNGIDTCINGQVIDRINLFYSEQELASYAKKYHITQLEEALQFYQNTKITNPASYRLFFADASVINRIDSNHHKNVLRNSPERHFRDHLLDFLNTHTQHDFYKEIELPASLRETDIFTEWEGKKYLIEIKWLGLCINKRADGFTDPVTDQSARLGVIQTLEYIDELIRIMNMNLKCGYLLVFDARNNKQPIDYSKHITIPTQLENYYKYNFKLLPKIDVTNRHPA